MAIYNCLRSPGGETQRVFHQGGGHLIQEQYAEAKDGWALFFERKAEDVAQD